MVYNDVKKNVGYVKRVVGWKNKKIGIGVLKMQPYLINFEKFE